MVSIKCQSQYNARLLAGCSLALSDGAGEPRLGPASPERLVLSPVSAPGAGGQRRSRNAREFAGSQQPLGPVTEADTRITLSQASHVGMGKGGGTKLPGRADLFFSPSPQSRLYKLIWSKGRKIKKTYKITIEKVILLGKAPLRLGGVFIPFFFLSFFLLLFLLFLKCSFPSAT